MGWGREADFLYVRSELHLERARPGLAEPGRGTTFSHMPMGQLATGGGGQPLDFFALFSLRNEKKIFVHSTRISTARAAPKILSERISLGQSRAENSRCFLRGRARNRPHLTLVGRNEVAISMCAGRPKKGEDCGGSTHQPSQQWEFSDAALRLAMAWTPGLRPRNRRQSTSHQSPERQHRRRQQFYDAPERRWALWLRDVQQKRRKAATKRGARFFIAKKCVAQVTIGKRVKVTAYDSDKTSCGTIVAICRQRLSLIKKTWAVVSVGGCKPRMEVRDVDELQVI
jgi:hypothetical protein